MLLEDLEKLVKPSPEPKYIDGYVETNVTNDQLLDNYIQQVSDQQNQIRELQKTIMELRSKIEEKERDLIFLDVEKILDGEGLSDYMINQVVDYILERENK